MSDVKNDAVVIDPKEFEVAQQEAENALSVYTHKFRKPFSYNGKVYNELTFNWDKCTGQDSLDIENECQALGKPVVVPTLSGEYLIRFAAKACTEKIGYDALLLMPIRDYNRIRSQARSFLLSTELWLPTVGAGSGGKR